MKKKIKRVRNHPSLAVWCGDNESNPQPPLEGWMAENIKTFDGGVAIDLVLHTARFGLFEESERRIQGLNTPLEVFCLQHPTSLVIVFF